MTALSAFLSEDEFDFTNRMASDLQEMENEFTGTTVFKYYSRDRRGFFAHPTIRFTQRTALNDPFELTRRWQEFGSVPTREAFTTYLRSSLRRLTKRRDVLLESLREHFAEQGVILGPEQMALAKAYLQSPAVEQFIATQYALIDVMIGPLMDHLFEHLAVRSDEMSLGNRHLLRIGDR